MTLEDFFTLTEMKDGLTALSRVHELVAVMQKEKDCTVKNVGDATRQWAAVASTIAATENKDCLDLFIKLDGLLFIDRWLKDAQNFGKDTADGFIEESLTALLRALEKLQIDKERSVSSGIWITVNNLLDHGCSRVQDRARALFNSWKQDRVSDSIHHDGSLLSSEKSREKCTAADVPLPNGNVDVENNGAESARDKDLQFISSSLQSERVDDVQIQTQENIEDKSSDPLSMPVLSNSVPESPLLKEKSSTVIIEGAALTEICSVPVPRGENTDEQELDSSKARSSFSDNSGMIVSPSSKVEAVTSSSVAFATSAKEDLAKPELQNNVDTEEGDFNSKTGCGDTGTSVSPTKTSPDDAGAMNRCGTLVLQSTAKDSCSPDTLQGSSDSDKELEKSDDVGTPFSRMELEDIGVADDDREHSSDGAEDVRDDSDISRPAMDTQRPDWINGRRSATELEYGIVDALEVARQVAQEVEREVIDYNEPSCSSSSGEVMETDTRQPDSPDSINGKQSPHMEVPREDMRIGENPSADVSPAEDGRLTSSNNVEAEAENGTQELESSLVTEVAPEPEANTEKGLCGFDLNQEVCSDDMDRPMNPISTPISVVSASRPTAVSGSPYAPLQFEGILGWKGSAATSAFRPASPRRASDVDRILETGGTSSSSKQRQDSLVIDLNVAEDGDEKMIELTSGRQIPVTSGLHSGESSIEVGPRRSERPNLDLNRISDDGDAPGLRIQEQLFYPRNGHRSPSPASSSSSMQPSLRNFDLNDRPLFHNDSLDQGLYSATQNVGAFVGPRRGDPVISIMGTRVEVGGRMEIGRKDFHSQFPNGKPMDPAMDANMARMGGVLGIPTGPFAHSPVFGYNGLTTAPMSIYGHGSSVPYMIDTRGAPVMPQILGSASPVPTFSQPSFIMSMTGAPVSLNGAGPSRHNFDLNSGFANEGGNTGGLRQLFMPGQTRSMEEHLRVNAQPSSGSGVGGKRREPDSGWEPYSLPYKHPQPPWR
ncbi:uncharacterized protein LOC126688227 [Mercurialis annua]|uniref:uncharacterized protein LOC126688227 n=1 Tax=Mercurialis annua TaxID=3986 RepID=UPI00215F9C2F|nr:uncharacterized protein LOC126688227 [Mercurialis annua]XP_050238822.1 uncharacterized protein LOC126688227 [Mercurialis annua]XP_050238830.1 uncharacterized protein LOC126688227 [Mercurialis annua]